MVIDPLGNIKEIVPEFYVAFTYFKEQFHDFIYEV